MKYQCDKNKAASNLQKHRIEFADAVSVFSDDLALTIPDNRFDEDRFVTIGMDAFGRLLIVVFTWRSEDIRLISARLAERHELDILPVINDEDSSRVTP